MNLGDMMTKDIITCAPGDTLSQTALKMQRENIGICPVVERGELLGVITDRDITTRAVARGFDTNQKTVRDVMTPSPITGDPSMSLQEACQLMSHNQIRRLPIVDNGKLVGIVALADLAIDLEEDVMVAQTLENISSPSR